MIDTIKMKLKLKKRVVIRNLLFLYINDLSSNYYCSIADLRFTILQ
jgi:hypothetical protein